MYPDQLNQLNNQMSNLNVAQAGYNKLWVFIFIECTVYIYHMCNLNMLRSLMY